MTLHDLRFFRSPARAFACVAPFALACLAGCTSYGAAPARAASTDCARVAVEKHVDGPPGDPNAIDGPAPAAPIPVMSAIEPSPARRPQCVEPRANVIAKGR